jgi:methyl-accepting chemotaxis protein
MTSLGVEGPREQHNHGSGPFIGRDNYGQIRFETLDPKTKVLLAKLSEQAPALAGLLTKALKDGIISPDTAAALERAVRNINEDVAHALYIVSRNINWDVADSLSRSGQQINADVANSLMQTSQQINGDVADSLSRTGQKINGDVAETLRQTAESLSESAHGLDHTLPSLNATVERANEVADRIKQFLTPPAPKIIVNWKATLTALFWGFVAGAIGGGFLIYHLLRR